MNTNLTYPAQICGENLYKYEADSGDYNSPYRFNGKDLGPETGNYYYGVSSRPKATLGSGAGPSLKVLRGKEPSTAFGADQRKKRQSYALSER